MYFVYIIESIKTKKDYIGYTKNIKKRLEYHNKGSNRSTKLYQPYKLIYQEEFNSKTEALKREKRIKSYKGGKAFKLLIN